MFKQVDYSSTKDVPGLSEKIAALIPLIEHELGDSADRISLYFRLTNRGNSSDPYIEIELEDDIAGKGISGTNCSEIQHFPKVIAARVRLLHRDINSKFLKKLVEKLKRNLATPVEA